MGQALSAKLNSFSVFIQIPNCRHLVLPYLIIECISNSCRFPVRQRHLAGKPLTFIATRRRCGLFRFFPEFSVYNLWSARDLHAALVKANECAYVRSRSGKDKGTNYAGWISSGGQDEHVNKGFLSRP